MFVLLPRGQSGTGDENREKSETNNSIDKEFKQINSTKEKEPNQTQNKGHWRHKEKGWCGSQGHILCKVLEDNKWNQRDRNSYKTEGVGF